MCHRKYIKKYIEMTAFSVQPMECPQSEHEATLFENITSESAFRTLERDWEDLTERSSQPRFSQAFVWCWTNWDVVERPLGRRLHCLVGRQSGRVVLIWPFVIYRRYGVSIARPLGGAHTEYTDPLLEVSAEADHRIELAWNFLRQTCPCDYFFLPSVREESRLHQMFSKNGVQCSSKTISLWVDWSGIEKWEDYCGKLSKSMLQQNKRRRRRLNECGRVTFDLLDGDSCAPAIDWHLRTKFEQLARTNFRAPLLLSKAYRDHLVLGASRGGPNGRISVWSLKLSNRIIATTVIRVDKFRIEVLNSTYDVAFSKYAVSRMLRLEILKWAFDRRLEFDMRLGEYSHKRVFANRETSVLLYEISNSVVGSLHLRLLQCYRLAKRTFGRYISQNPAWFSAKSWLVGN